MPPRRKRSLSTSRTDPVAGMGARAIVERTPSTDPFHPSSPADDTYGFSNRMRRNFSTDHIPNDCTIFLQSVPLIEPLPFTLQTCTAADPGQWATTTWAHSSSSSSSSIGLSTDSLTVPRAICTRPCNRPDYAWPTPCPCTVPSVRCPTTRCPFDRIKTISSTPKAPTWPIIRTMRASIPPSWHDPP